MAKSFSTVLETKFLTNWKNNITSVCLFGQFFQPSFFFWHNGSLDGASCWTSPIIWTCSPLLDVSAWEKHEIAKGLCSLPLLFWGMHSRMLCGRAKTWICAEYRSNHDFIGLLPSYVVDYTIEKSVGGEEATMIDTSQL